jgi:hypothetical protein
MITTGGEVTDVVAARVAATAGAVDKLETATCSVADGWV